MATVKASQLEGALSNSEEQSPNSEPSLAPDDSYSFLSRSFLLWTCPILSQGRKKTLTATSIPRLSSRFHAEVSLKRFLELWEEEQKRPSPSLLRVLVRMPMGANLCWASLFGCMQGLSMVVLRPIVLKRLIELVGVADSQTEASYWLLVFFATTVFETLWLTWVQHLFSEQYGTSMIATLGVAIQHKSIRLAPGQGGNETGLVGADVIRQFHFLLQIGLLPSSLCALAGGFVMLIYLIGWPGLVGFMFMSAFSIICFTLSRMSKRHDKQYLGASDKRLSIMKQMIVGIKAVKFCAWEEQFEQRLTNARITECDAIQKFRAMAVASSSLGRSAPILAAAFAFVVMALASDENEGMNPASVYAALAVFLALRMPMILLPMGLTFAGALQVSLKRLQNYLELPERTPQQYAPEAHPNSAVVIHDTTFNFFTSPEQVKEAAQTKQAVEAKKAALAKGSGNDSGESSDESTASTAAAPFTLHVKDLEVKHGELVAVVGAVGSGKSALLAGILGDMQGSEKVVCNALTKAYVPQKAIVITGTIRENILMGLPFDAAAYQTVLDIAALAHDLGLLPEGDSTVVGERGVTLSGGQQQRLAIARAVYCNPELLVLDDPLAAVDPVVASTIFGNLRQWWQKRNSDSTKTPMTILMAINQLHLLREFEQIVYMDGGEIVRHSDFATLMAESEQGAAKGFTELVARHGQEGGDNIDNAVDNAGIAKADKPAATPAAAAAADSKALTVPPKNSLIKAETKQEGRVKGNTFRQFFGAMGCKAISLCVLTGVCGYSVMLFADFWLATWLADEKGLKDKDTRNMYLGTYLAMAVAHVLLCQLTSHYFLEGCINACKTLHHDCIRHLLHAPVSWYEATPSGRILSRFSADLNVIDILLGTMSDPFIQLVFMCIAFAVGMLIVVPQLIVVIIISAPILLYVTRTVEASVLELKRLTNNAMSPVMTNMAEVSQSRLLIHTMALAPMFIARQNAAFDTYNRINYSCYSLVNWMKMCTQFLCALIAIASAGWIVAHPEDYAGSNSADNTAALSIGSNSTLITFVNSTSSASEGGRVGVSLTYALTMPMLFAFVVTLKSQLATMILSVERLLEYSPSTKMLPQEAAWDVKGDDALAVVAGQVEFKSVTLIYRPGLPPALRDVTICFCGREHTGVIGRTGAGKSSLLVLLFRLVEAATGSIMIDGVDIAKMGLMALRRRMAIIPQQPLLLMGSVSHNLDPFDEFEPEQLASVLQRVGLLGDRSGSSKGHEQDAAEQSDDEAHSSNLAAILAREVSAGVGLSAGEQQLISFARSLLRIEHGEVKVVIMDEPTANIDMETDEKIQRLVRSTLNSHTVITIAHRLNTVIDFDKILVMDSGTVLEHGEPAALLRDPTSRLSETVNAMGCESAAKLVAKANAAEAARAT
jgi:ABC-type multidrug transport system fused ATPase/permease subunit